MTDMRRLGKLGAYRLGELRTESDPKRPHVPDEPSFRDPRHLLAWLVAVVAVGAVVAIGAYLGAWFLPFVAGLAAGLLSRYVASLPCLAGLVVAVLIGWALPLAWQSLTGAPVGATARTIASLAGLPPHTSVGVAVTLLVGVSQALVAFWLTRAASR